jgi:precorrin-3B C17-methyltransferase
MKIIAAGLGPGDAGFLAPAAREAILGCDVVAGYTPYLELISELTEGKKIIATGMKSESERCESAIGEALKGRNVCVVSSGDAGIYGMAALLFEMAEGHPEVEIEVIPGITAAASAAAILGSPLTNDFAVISLSDLLTPWDVIEKRLDACASADMALCLYNPQSIKRSDYLAKACAIVMRHKPHETCCGYVKNAFRGDRTESRTCTLAELSSAQVDMFTTVIIGNSATKMINGKLVTTRGYRR